MAEKNAREMVAILDIGSQYSQLIAPRVRELKVYGELLPYNIRSAELAENNPKAMIIPVGQTSLTAVQSSVRQRMRSE